MAPSSKKVKRIDTIQDETTSRILEWCSNVPELKRSDRKRGPPVRYGFEMSAPPNPKRRRTDTQLPRIAALKEQDAQTSRSRSKSPSRASNITDVNQLGRYHPPIYFKTTWEFEASINEDETISQQLQTLIQMTQIRRTPTHNGVIPLALKVEFPPKKLLN